MGLFPCTISKSYKKVKAVHDISVEMKPEELFALIGPHDAGKITIFRILTTLLLSDQDKAILAGCDVVTDYKVQTHSLVSRRVKS